MKLPPPSRLMTSREFLKHFPNSPLVSIVGFLSSDSTTPRHSPDSQGSGGFSVYKQRERRLWQLSEQLVSGFLSFLMVHIPLSTSVSDFLGTTLILHQTFPRSLCILLLSGRIIVLRADLSIKMFGFIIFLT